VIGTAVSSLVMTLQLAFFLRRELHGFEVVRTLKALVLMTLAAVAFGLAAYGVWRLLDEALGRALIAQVVSVGGGLLAGVLVYAGLVTLLRVPEAQQLGRLLARRTGR